MLIKIDDSILTNIANEIRLILRSPEEEYLLFEMSNRISQIIAINNYNPKGTYYIQQNGIYNVLNYKIVNIIADEAGPEYIRDLNFYKETQIDKELQRFEYHPGPSIIPWIFTIEDQQGNYYEDWAYMSLNDMPIIHSYCCDLLSYDNDDNPLYTTTYTEQYWQEWLQGEVYSKSNTKRLTKSNRSSLSQSSYSEESNNSNNNHTFNDLYKRDYNTNTESPYVYNDSETGEPKLYNKPAEKIVLYIKFTKIIKVPYEIGNTFNSSDYQVVAYFNDSSSMIITNECNYYLNGTKIQFGDMIRQNMTINQKNLIAEWQYEGKKYRTDGKIDEEIIDDSTGLNGYQEILGTFNQKIYSKNDLDIYLIFINNINEVSYSNLFTSSQVFNPKQPIWWSGTESFNIVENSNNYQIRSVERKLIKLYNVPLDINKIIFTINIFSTANAQQNKFKKIDNTIFYLNGRKEKYNDTIDYESSNLTTLYSYDIKELLGDYTAAEIGELHRISENQWEWVPTLIGYTGDVGESGPGVANQKIKDKYGITD